MELNELVSGRWSPRSFLEREVSSEDVTAVLEAARWAPSSSNMQPWRFLVATTREAEAREKLMQGLVPANRRWAERAPVIMVVMARGLRDNGQPNAHAWYDTGAAVSQLTAEATARGLFVHQMGGIDAGALREAGQIPAELEVICALVMGYVGPAEALPEELAARETAPRQRKALEEVVRYGSF